MKNTGPEDSLFEDVPDEPAIPMEDDERIDEDPDEDAAVVSNLFSDCGDGTIMETMEPAAPVAKPGLVQRLEDKVFSLLYRKKKPAAKKAPPAEESKTKEQPFVHHIKHADHEAVPDPGDEISPEMNHINPEAVRQLLIDGAAADYHFSRIQDKPARENKILRVVVTGLALLFFAAGAFSIYSELPTHPTIVLGMILMSISGSVLVNAK